MEQVKPHTAILNGPQNEAKPVSSGNSGVLVKPVFAKYGEAAIGGFQAVPDLLLKNQAKLGISPTDMVVLLNVLMHWWYPANKPFPRSGSISKRIGVTPRTVQRSIINLEKAGLLIRETSEGRTYLNPKPLVDRLEEIAPTDKDYLYRKGRMNAA